MNPDDLARASLSELEDLYASAPLARAPQGAGADGLPGGLWRGRYLHDLPMTRVERTLSHAMFKWVSFGLDLDERAWWFGRPDAGRLRRALGARRMGHFDATLGRSRWRDAEVVQLDYSRRTGGPAGARLYDELRPLSATCILGLGGVRRDTGGDWFFFALEPL